MQTFFKLEYVTAADVEDFINELIIEGWYIDQFQVTLMRENADLFNVFALCDKEARDPIHLWDVTQDMITYGKDN